MSNETLLFHVDARGVATCTFNRPTVRNAYDGQLLDALAERIAFCDGDDGVRILILRGNGPVFQAGADLGWISSFESRSEEDLLESSRQTAETFFALLQCGVPTLALVHGGCFGGGVGFAASCDIVIATRDTRFAITEARWGLLPSIIVPQLNGSIGIRNVRRFALSGERFDAETARSIGLVHEVCEEGALDGAAAPIVDSLLSSAPGSIRGLKRLALEDAGVRTDEDYLDRLIRLHAERRRSAEAREGVASFLAKRPAAWVPPST